MTCIKRRINLCHAAILAIAIFLPLPVLAETVIKIGGVGSSLGTMRLLAEAYEKNNANIRVEILPSLGTPGGLKALGEGALDFSLAGRDLKEDERAKDVVAVEYARTPFIFVTYKGNKKSDITVSELCDILRGQRATWDDGSMIRVIFRPEAETNTKILRGISSEVDAALYSALQKPGIIIAVSDQDSTAMLQRVPGCFGFSTLTDIVTTNVQVKILSFNGKKPTTKALSEGSYPLYKRLFIVTSSSTPAPAKKFIDFIFSPAGREIVSNSGNVVIEGR